MTDGDEDPLLPVSEVARRFSVSDQTVYRWIDNGLLPVVKVRRLFRIRTSDVDRLLADASRPAPTPTGSWSDVPPEGRRMR